MLVCGCLCVGACVWVLVCVGTCVGACVWVLVCVGTCVGACVSACVWVLVCGYLCVGACVWVLVCGYLCVGACVWVLVWVLVCDCSACVLRGVSGMCTYSAVMSLLLPCVSQTLLSYFNSEGEGLTRPELMQNKTYQVCTRRLW